MAETLKEDVEESNEDLPAVDGQVEEVHLPEATVVKLEVIEQSGSQRAIENLLKVYYEPLELWYLRSSVEKVSPTRFSPKGQI